MDYFDYGIEDFIPCEICECRAVDIHHIECRGYGGSKAKDNIENLMALCRECHVYFGDKKEHKENLIKAHAIKIIKK
jgi:5-methylcytosine-specific restriction endonuclease McrA